MKPTRPKRTRLRAKGTRSDLGLTDAAVTEIEAALGHRFRNREVLIEALTHRSAAGAAGKGSNERLEFLGDAVLGLVIADLLMQRYPTAREGELSRRSHRLVSGEACAEVADRTGLSKFLIMDASDRAYGAAAQTSVKADLAEAVIGAMYADGGLKPARAFIARAWSEALKSSGERLADPKTRLQELALAEGRGLPTYTEVDRTGPDHAPVFTVSVMVESHGEAQGEGRSKQAAERAAATAMLARLKQESDTTYDV